MSNLLATIALGPLILIQGCYVRWRTPKLPEPPGPHVGSAGSGPPLRLLVAGDSAAAGVGAASQSEALIGQLVARLRNRFRVDWRLEAETGATTHSTIARLARLKATGFDVLITSLGVNDITRGVGTHTWLKNQRELRSFARNRLGVTQLIIASLPPVDGFPALPQPLRWYLGSRAKQLNGLLEKELASEPSAHFLDLRFTLDPALMACDGFHPGPAIYEGWAQRASELIFQASPLYPSSGERP